MFKSFWSFFSCMDKKERFPFLVKISIQHCLYIFCVKIICTCLLICCWTLVHSTSNLWDETTMMISLTTFLPENTIVQFMNETHLSLPFSSSTWLILRHKKNQFLICIFKKCYVYTTSIWTTIYTFYNFDISVSMTTFGKRILIENTMWYIY